MFTKSFLSRPNPTPPASIFFSGSGGTESTIGNKNHYNSPRPSFKFLRAQKINNFNIAFLL